MDATAEDTKPIRRVGRPKKVADAVESVDASNAAQAYADRVWAGQSPDVPVAERLSRVRAALAGQNLDCGCVFVGGNKL